MIHYDEQFLKEVGLQAMAPDKKRAFLSHTQEELEVRVGERVSEGMTVEQLREFEGIMKKDRNIMGQILKRLGDEYREDGLLVKLMQRKGVARPDEEIMSEYLSVKWIEKNRPNYREIIEEVAGELKLEIVKAREKILLAMM